MTNPAAEPQSPEPKPIPVAVVGGGVTGMTAALALAQSGTEVALIALDGAAPVDLRTAALFPASVQLLRHLGVWQSISEHASPLAAIRIIDDTSWVLKAPEAIFWADELDQLALAWNIANAALSQALADAVAERQNISWITTGATPSYRMLSDGIEIDTVEGERMIAKLIVAADGRNSPLRAFAGITAHQTTHDQTALVTSFSHGRPHRDVSNEIHRDAGPLTTVPLPGQRSSLVWVERPREAARLAALGQDPFRALLHERLQGLLGRIDEVGPRMTFPLSTLEVGRFAKGRIALIGEAAHVLPPIGAQGLNLGLRDVGELVEVVQPLLDAGTDPGEAMALDLYDRRRRLDAGGRGRGVDMLNASLASGALGLQLARGAGLHLLNRLGPLKRTVMRAGAQGLGPLPRLMREDPSTASGPM